ncbi:protein ACCELERATED CELL DEATH [Salix suchowensis]|nr:protein ACCELERATED CELL DEATH [Salix suchowensis]
MTTNISPTSIVVEVLRDDNYDDWSACMKSYMIAHDLWDLIEPAHHQEEVDSKAWRKKNAAALHAIQVSCSPRILSKIRSIFSAKEAWDSLANSLFVEAESSQGAVSDERNGPLLDLYKYAHNGDWNAIENYLRQYPDAIKAKIKPYGGTALHVAIYAGNLNVVEELVRLMSEEDLQIQDDKGNTALFSAATVGITKMAKCLVNKNPNLLTFVNEDKQIPLTVACLKNCKEMALYLYSVTPDQFLCQDNGHHGSDLLQCAIILQMLDIAYDFLYRHPNMTTTMDDGIRIPPIATPDDNFRIYIPDQSLSGSRNNTLQVLSKFRGFAINLLTFLGIKQIYDLKKIHMYSDKILRCMCEHVSKLGYEEGLDADIIEAFHSAVGNGIAEYVVEVVKACPYLIHRIDYRSRSPFMSSIANRHEKVFSLFYRLEASRATFVRPIDGLGDTMLRLAAKLSPPSQLSRVSGAALQMQRELQWFKEVESIMNPLYEDNVDEYIQTSRELFTHEHKDLLVKGEQWMKQAATSCTVVGALIITIMFNAAFNVPGGNIQQTGYPVFKDKKSFTIFIVADAISFFSSSTSVLMFLGILTSRYAEEDFLKSLPTKLILGLSTLFLSIAAMMVTFCTALIIMLNGRLKIIIPIVLLASIPVTFFIFLQFPLLVEIYGSTYGPGIVNKKMKRWY